MQDITGIEDTLRDLAESAYYAYNEIEALEEMMQDEGIKPSQIEYWNDIQKLKKAAKPIKCEITEVTK